MVTTFLYPMHKIMLVYEYLLSALSCCVLCALHGDATLHMRSMR